jgi:DNA primase
VTIYTVAARFFADRMAGSWVPGYLAGRGLGGEALERWQVGYAPDHRDALIRHLRRAGYADPLILAAGLARRSRRGYLVDVFRDRAMLPIRSPRGQLIAFIGRTGGERDYGRPRYLNSPTTFCYTKKEILFGLHEARGALAAGGMPVIVEGPLDVVAVALAGGGAYGPVAPCGSALSAAQARALAQAGDLEESGVLVVFDADDAGRRAAAGAYARLRPHTRRALTVTLPPGTDPARLLAAGGPEALARALAQQRRPLADLVLDSALAPWQPSVRFPEGQVGALRAIAPVIAAMAPSDVARQAGRLALGLSLRHELVADALAEAVSG